ncbi:MAG: hypothetical protein K8S94_04120 [Planctomycetia bacterium]|nr:hypothetical protein [Planctomycetia bacterium]
MVSSGIGETWTRFWFTPADARPLAIVRILTATLGLLLLWSYAGDLQAWFGPGGMIPRDVAAAWRPRFGVSLFDLATTPASLQALFAATVVAFVALLVGVGSRIAAVVSAVLWASLLHRGPMLVGPADDCLAVLLWCLVVGPCGRDLSIDRWLAARAGGAPPAPSAWARVSLGLLQVHASALTVAAVLAQLRGDVWWDGTAAWWLAVRASRVVDLAPLYAYARSEYLMNLVTHAIVAFEILFAVGLWFATTQRTIARIGLVAWPLVGIVAGEPLWGLAMGIFAVPLALDASPLLKEAPSASAG